MKALELRLLALFAACWMLGLARVVDLVPALPALAPSLYLLYGTAAALGWLAGNVYTGRCRHLTPSPRQRRWLLILYLAGPPGVPYLFWSLHPTPVLWALPLIPLYSLGVYATLFAVPVILRPAARRR